PELLPEQIVRLDEGLPAVIVLDQRLLPESAVELTCRTIPELADAIRTLAVRGAPAIGVAAAYGRALDELRDDPTPAHARALHDAEVERCMQMSAHAAELFEPGTRALTHCNAGGLATGGYGSAVGALRAAWERDRLEHVLVDETRPLLQGARLTAWELEQLGIPHAVIADSAAASMMARGEVDLIVTGADRIAANGDAANKIGTYGLAVLAKHHGIPFYVVAPTSTVDAGTPNGDGIVIEERDGGEITQRFNARN